MSTLRKWYCRCTGKSIELEFSPLEEESEFAEPACRFCGATPSSDPRQTLSSKDEETWDD